MTKIVPSSRNAPKCKSTDTNIKKCLPRRQTQLLSTSQTCSHPFPRTQRIRFLLNCVASREAINSSRGFHSMQSSPLRPPGLYYILIHSERKKKKKPTDRKFPPEPYNHCNNDILKPRPFYLTVRPENKSGLRAEDGLLYRVCLFLWGFLFWFIFC